MWILLVKFKIFILLALASSSRGDGCSSGWFQCSNGKCIAEMWVCDGSDDCGNLDDEKNCDERKPNACLSGQFKCKSNNHCLPAKWRCDGEVDCLDRSDEINCGNVTTCTGFICRDGHCIPRNKHCDKFKDCSDGSDEELCDYGKMCSELEFACSSGSCLNQTLVCDGKNDCIDGSDEGPHCANTVCQPEELQCPESKRCIRRELVCDGKPDCSNGSDEEGCVTITTLPVSKSMLLAVKDSCNEMKCSQYCRNTTSGPRCYCKNGFELDRRDNQTCIDIKDSELTFFNEGRKVYTLKRRDGNKMIDLLSDFRMAITGLSFQPKMHILYIADEEPSIYAVNLSSLHVRILVKNDLSSPKDVKFDWMSNNLYWVDTDKGTIEVISVDTLKRIILIDDLSKPVSLAISPYRGNMFVSETGLKACVSMYGMDGKDRTILHSVQGFPMSLTLHPSETLLYWSDPRQEIISYVNYTSESPSRILMMNIKGVMSVAASADEIFYTADETSEQTDRKRSYLGKVHRIQLFEHGRDKGWKSITYSHGMKPSGKSECLIENGGCSYLCLTSPNGRTCACSSEMTLDEDGKTCLGKQCARNYFQCSDEQCIPAGMKCDGEIDCNDGSDEQDCKELES